MIAWTPTAPSPLRGSLSRSCVAVCCQLRLWEEVQRGSLYSAAQEGVLQSLHVQPNKQLTVVSVPPVVGNDRTPDFILLTLLIYVLKFYCMGNWL